MNKTGQLNTRLTEDVNKVHDGTGDKIGSALQFIACFISGLTLGYFEFSYEIYSCYFYLASLKDGN